MIAMRNTRAAGGAAGAAIVSVSLLAAVAFVAPPHARSGALRGSDVGRVAPFRAHAPQPVDEPPRAMGWASFASLMAALGLVAGMATTPVRAEEAAPAAAPATEAPAAPATPAAAPVEPAAAEISTYDNGGRFAKGGRAKAKRDASKSVATKKTSSSSGSSGSVFVGSSAGEEGKKKIILSPADERDEDELSLSRTNRPLLVLLALTPASIFLVFWTLGSLEII